MFNAKGTLLKVAKLKRVIPRLLSTFPTIVLLLHLTTRLIPAETANKRALPKTSTAYSSSKLLRRLDNGQIQLTLEMAVTPAGGSTMLIYFHRSIASLKYGPKLAQPTSDHNDRIKFTDAKKVEGASDSALRMPSPPYSTGSPD